MTQEEIVTLLKENKKKGVAYLFMPLDVKDWISDNFNNSNLVYLDSMGDWELYKDANFDDYDNIVFALSDDYKEEPKGEWVDFVVTDKGCFYLRYRDNGGSDVSRKFYWHQWSQFLEYSDLGDLGFTAFGGWKFDGYDSWITHPVVDVKTGNYITDDYIDEGKDVRPSIPIKIRFWRDARADVEFY